MYKFRNVIFEDVDVEDGNSVWTGICQSCVDKHNVNEKLLDNAGCGHCMVEGCNNTADYYIDMPSDEVIEIE